VQEVLNKECNAIEKASGPCSNFLSLLLQLSDEDQQSGQSQFLLSDDEVSGSLFIFTMAGYETTANTMGYSVSFLAAYPEWQEWIREELQGLSEDPSMWKYKEVFPKCRRTLALMVRF
jgi:cytochrome P450